MIGQMSGYEFVGLGRSSSLAFSVLDIEATIANGGPCDQCGELAWKMSYSLGAKLLVVTGTESPSPENVVINKTASDVIDVFLSIAAKAHTEH